MNNVTNIRDYLGRKQDNEFRVCTMEQFINTMNGPAYDDSGYVVELFKYPCPVDGELIGWWIMYYNPEDHMRYVVANDDHNGINDFILDYRSIEEITDILCSLKECGRVVNLNISSPPV